jgi:OmpA-OmpF porin, OOP family
MKKIAAILLAGVFLFSCKENKKSEESNSNSTKPTNSDIPKVENKTNEINWESLPELKEIGNYPFITAPKDYKIENEKNGVSESFEYQTMYLYNGKTNFTIEGKLGIIWVSEGNYNQKFFDKSVLTYLDGIGAQKIHDGTHPEEEVIWEHLRKNMFSGKVSSHNIKVDRQEPFYIYAFKNNSKKYVVTVQSNSASGTIFIMELKEFEQTIKKYSAAEMQTEIDKNGKAILNINFDTDKATIKTDGQTIVNEIFTLLNSNQALKISIEGHTDNTGNIANNKQLSLDRANTVMEELIKKGINKERLKTSGFGSEKPLKPNNTEENKAENRRVELVKFQ